MLNLDWRSQFDADLSIFLCLLAIWVAWREGFTPKGFLFGLMSFFLGSMFLCPYLLFSTYNAKGDPKLLLLGGSPDK